MTIERESHHYPDFSKARELLTQSQPPQNEAMGSQVRELFPEYIGRSSKVLALLDIVLKAAQTDSSVLISGESGTGKELIASALHRLSSRSLKRFVPINCSAIPENLLEAELFGYEKGAFTGAVSRRAGHFEVAHGGTIFLDEIGEMPPNLQVKLLRVLQEKQYSPVGSSFLKNTDVRVVAATNVKLEEAVKDTKFRLDLYYRLNVLPIVLPPLRERGDDIDLLLEHFLNLMNRKHPAKEPCFLDGKALSILKHYPWPGNVRELQNLIERLVVMSSGGRISSQDLPAEMIDRNIEVAATPQPSKRQTSLPGENAIRSPQNFGDLPQDGLDLTKVVEDVENKYILQALERTNNNKNQAAKLLGLNRTTLVERIKKRKLAPINMPSKEL